MKPSTMLGAGAFGSVLENAAPGLGGILPINGRTVVLSSFAIAAVLLAIGFLGHRPSSRRALAVAAGLAFAALAIVTVADVIATSLFVVIVPVNAAACLLAGLTLVATQPIRDGVGRWAGGGLIVSTIRIVPLPNVVSMVLALVFAASVLGLAWRFFRLWQSSMQPAAAV